MDYEAIFRKAWGEVMNSWNLDKIRFWTEYDLQGHLFSACLELIRQEKRNETAHVYSNLSQYYVKGDLPKIDLVLGENHQIIAEFKYNKPPNWKAVIADLDKLQNTFSTLRAREDCKTKCGFFGTLFKIRGINTIETYRESLAPHVNRSGMSADWKETEYDDWLSLLVSVCQ